MWWSHDQALPSAFVITKNDRVTRFSIERIHLGLDADCLRPPSTRFPTYRVVDLAGWLEGTDGQSVGTVILPHSESSIR